MLIILFLGTIFLLAICYLLTGYDFIAPASIFCETFLLAIIICICFRNMYDINLHPYTVLVILGGEAIFVLFTGVFRRSSLEKKVATEESMKTHPIKLNCIIEVLFILLQLAVLYYNIVFIMQVTTAYGLGSSSLLSAAGNYHDITLFDPDGYRRLGISPPAVYGIGYPICSSYAYIIIFIIVNNFFASKKVDILQICIVVLYSFEQMLSGGRSGIFRVITAFIFLWLIFYSVKISKRSLKMFFRIMLIAILILFFMLRMIVWLGRTDTMDLTYVLRIVYGYIGAPIQNLDTFLQKGDFGSDLFGAQTFHNLYSFFGTKFSILKYQYNLDLPFLYHNGINTGNVYTTFYQWIYDFGYSGVVPLISGIALFYNGIYYMLKNNWKKHKLMLIIYAYLFNDLIMLVFSNRFYEVFVSYAFLKFFIILYVFYWFFIKKDIIVRNFKIKLRQRI